MGSQNNKLALIRDSTKKAPTASFADNLPSAKGLPLVRLTEPSTFLSAKSLIAQPAARISIAPSAKISSTDQEGSTLGNAVALSEASVKALPKAAKNTAQSVGHKSSSIPTGLSKRVK